jgi:hypothetical protein
MTPIGFPESNATLHAHPDQPFDHNVKAIEPLQVWRDGWQVTSCWRPTWRERLSILLFGRVWLTVLGGATPPVSLQGTRAYFLTGKAAERAIRERSQAPAGGPRP